MNEVIMAKFGELALKGLNRRTFEDILVRNIKRSLAKCGSFTCKNHQSTLYIVPNDETFDLEEAQQRLLKIFGIASVQRSLVLPKDMNMVIQQGIPYLKQYLEHAKTFKVEAKRADKTFPLNTPEIQQVLGRAVGEANPHLEVDVRNPEVLVLLEIRENNAYLNAHRLTGAGGMPVGSSGSALILLSGGIDSPVAGYMMAKRGVALDCIHFVSPPYTSERALMKVETLCEKMVPYCGPMRLHIVPFTDIQVAIKDHCPEEYFTIIMRRIMMKIAGVISEKKGYGALITGESLAQVASQTLSAIACTDEAASLPVLRPLIGMDKKEIVDIARKIDTFDTSILPYEDCCTIFTPRHPCTKPKLSDVLEAEAHFDFSSLIEVSITNIVSKDMME